jgi:hypothetical protein
VVGLAIVFHGPPALARWTAYLLIAAPPLLDGASQDNLTLALPAVAVTDRGALGAVTAATSVPVGVGARAAAAAAVGEVVLGARSALLVPATPTATLVAAAATTMLRRRWLMRFTNLSLSSEGPVGPAATSMTTSGLVRMSSDHSTCVAASGE